MLMYIDHLQNWLDYGNSLLIFLCLTPLWFSETGQIWSFRAFPGEPIEEMACNFACWCILTTFKTDKVMVTVCWFYKFWHYFDLMGQIWGFRAFWSWSVDFPHYCDPLTETSHIWGFWALSGECVGVNIEGVGSGGIFPTLCVEFCLVFFFFFFKLKSPNTSIQTGKLLGTLEVLKPVGLFHMDDLNKKLCWCYVARRG